MRNFEYEIETVAQWYTELRDNICNELEKIESAVSDKKFVQESWNREGGGGGTMSIMRGEVFEKAGVNISVVHGKFSEEFAHMIDGAIENDMEFWASGVSVVVHSKSPLVPAIHMNTRMIVTSKLWFGGGVDLTPNVPNQKHYDIFHGALKDMCDKHDPGYHEKFKSWCDHYFYLKHRNEPRGIGGIFYDNLNTGKWDKDFAFNQDVGKTFIETYKKIALDSYQQEWSPEDKKLQVLKRSRYVEFNLLYDRGTEFGLKTGGNIDAIFMSMPPEAAW